MCHVILEGPGGVVYDSHKSVVAPEDYEVRVRCQVHGGGPVSQVHLPGGLLGPVVVEEQLLQHPVAGVEESVCLQRGEEGQRGGQRGVGVFVKGGPTRGEGGGWEGEPAHHLVVIYLLGTDRGYHRSNTINYDLYAF